MKGMVEYLIIENRKFEDSLRRDLIRKRKLEAENERKAEREAQIEDQRILLHEQELEAVQLL